MPTTRRPSRSAIRVLKTWSGSTPSFSAASRPYDSAPVVAVLVQREPDARPREGHHGRRIAVGSQLGLQRVRATSVAGSEGITFMARSSARSRSVTICSRSVASSASSRPCRSWRGSGSAGGEGPGEVRRVLGQVALVGVGPDLGERGAVGGERGPRPHEQLFVDGRLALGPVDDVADREGAAGVQALELDPLDADDLDRERPVGVRLHLGELHPAADPEQRLGAVLADLVALADADRAEHPLRSGPRPAAGGGPGRGSGPRRR